MVPYDGMRPWCIHDGVKPVAQCTDISTIPELRRDVQRDREQSASSALFWKSHPR